jgi:iron complex outermembrane receptor protein
MNTPHDCIRASVSPRLRALTTARLLAAFAVSGFAAYAQTASSPSTATTPTTADVTTATPGDQPSIQLGTYKVNGYSQSLETSLDTKRASDDNIDVISAEDVGKFPDTNLAEALSHIPGVTVDRLFGEGERVSILGTDPNLNRTLFNGEPIASADWYILDTPSRQFDYLLIAPEVIGQAEVYRTWEARLLEGSIGGTIIVNTLDPFKGNALAVSGTAGASYFDLDKKWEPSYSAMVSWHDPKKTLGILIGAEDQKDYVRRDGVEALGVVGNYTNSAGIVVQNTYAGPPPPPATSPADTGLPQAGTATKAATGPGNFATDEVINTALFEQIRHRQGTNGTVDWKPTSDLELNFTALYVDENLDNTNTSFYPEYFAGGAATNFNITHGILTSATFGPGSGISDEYDIFARMADIKTQDYNLKMTFKGDDFKAIGTVGFTRATGGTQEQAYRGTNISDGATINEGSSFANYSLNSGPTYASTGDVVLSGGNAGYGGLVEEPEVDQEEWAQMDFEVPLHNGFLNKLLLGFRSSVHDQSESSYHQVMFNGPGERDYLALFQPAPSNYLSGLNQITASMATHPVATLSNLSTIINQTGNTPASAFDVAEGLWPGLQVGETLAQYSVSHPTDALNVFLGLPTDSATVGPTFNAREVINAAYFETDFSENRFSGNIGVRIVQTRTTGTSVNVAGLNGQPLTPASLGQFGAPGYQPLTPADIAAFTPAEYAAVEVPINTSVKTTYNNVLPAMNLAYDVAPNMVARFATAEVISRPNLLQEFGYTTLYPLNSSGDIGGNGVGGTPGINPYKATNFDADYEWYFTKNSYVSVDLFYKDIANYIVNETTPEIHANTTTFEDQYFYVTRPQNGGTATSKGVALSYQQALADGFGIQTNYTRLQAEGKTGPLPYASKDQVNIGPYFEDKYGLLRLTYSWRDDYATGSFNGSSTVFTRPYTELDANAQINITKNLALILSARNLTNETYQQYFTLPNGGGQLFADAYKEGSSFSASIHFVF